MMSTAPRYFGKAGSALALERLNRYRRYGELVSSQESALDAEDWALFEELGAAIKAIQQEIGSVDPEVFAQGEGDIAREATAVLEESVEAVERIRSRLTAMRRSSAEDIRNLAQRRPQARQYLTEESKAGSELSTLDVTF